VTTYYLQFYGQVSVAAFGVGTRIEQMALLPAIGLNAAIVSIVGQNNGAGYMDRVQETMKLSVKYGIYLIGASSILMYVLARPLVDLFTNDPEVIEVGTTYTRIMALIQWAYVMTFTHTGFLQAIKRPLYGFIESIIRKIVLPLGIFYVVVDVYQVGLMGFWFTMAIINVVMTIVTIIWAQSVLRKLVR